MRHFLVPLERLIHEQSTEAKKLLVSDLISSDEKDSSAMALAIDSPESDSPNGQGPLGSSLVEAFWLANLFVQRDKLVGAT